jgi:hypothetical protein
MVVKKVGARAKTSTLALVVKDQDFEILQGPKLAVAGAREMEADERIESVRKLLPSVIAKKIAERIPEGFELTQLTFTGEISGQPFGIGVSGQVSAVFERKKT